MMKINMNFLKLKVKPKVKLKLNQIFHIIIKKDVDFH